MPRSITNNELRHWTGTPFLSHSVLKIDPGVSIGSLSKHDVDRSENVIWKCNFTFLQSFLFKVTMLEKCVLTVLELNYNQRNQRTKLNICHHMLTSSTHLQNRSFHVVERTRTSSKCQKIENARAKRVKILFFILKYANLWGFCCCRRRRSCLNSLLGSLSTTTTTATRTSQICIFDCEKQ